MIFIIFLAVVCFYLLFFKGGFLGISFLKGNYLGFPLFKGFFFTVAVGVLVVNYVGIDGKHDFANTQPSSIKAISYLIYFSLFFYLLATFLFLKILKRKFNLQYERYYKTNNNDIRIAQGLIALCLMLMFLAIVVFGAQHAFFESLIRGGADLKSIRLGNVYESKMPTVVNSFLQFCYIAMACLIGAGKLKLRVKLVLLLLCIIATTFQGSKAPLANMVVIVFISYLQANRIKLSLKSVVFYFLYGVVLFATLSFVIRAQYGDLSLIEILQYLISRLGSGQLAGVYEQFNLKLNNINYIYHSVPFANWFIDYPVFNKDIMVVSENVKNATTTGVKNSLFIAEAYAIGGWGLVAFSPGIVAFSQISSFYLLFKIFIQKLKTSPAVSLMISGFLSYGMLSITGGIASFLFMKGLVMLLIMTGVLRLICYPLYAFNINIFRRPMV